MTLFEIGMYAAVLVIIAAVLWFVLRLASSPGQAASAKPDLTAVPGKRIPCILCGSVLVKGEKLHSKETIREKDSVIHMYGCPHCHGNKSTERKTCPVCKKSMSSDEYLIGRMWLKKNGKKHLHMSGCISCSGKV